MKPLLCCLLGFTFVFIEARGDEPTAIKAGGRSVEGKVVAAGNTPIEGTTILLGPLEASTAFEEGVRARTDAQGHYRADLGKVTWSSEMIRAIALAPGYKATESHIQAGKGTATANFELAAEPWSEAQIRMEDSSGRPVAGEVITCAFGGLIWSLLRTDMQGSCRIAMPRDLYMGFSTAPKGARPIVAIHPGTRKDPLSITLPVLPPIRGRVLDPEGRPMPDAAVGRWLTFDADDTGTMQAFAGGAVAVTDHAGNFEIAPTLRLRFYKARPTPILEELCFAAPSYRGKHDRLFHPNQPIRIAYRFVDPSRPVEPMQVTLPTSRRVRIPIKLGFVTPKRETQLYSKISIRPRKDLPGLSFPLINRVVKRKERSAPEAHEIVLQEYLPEGTYQLDVELEEEKTEEIIGEAHGEIVVTHGEEPLALPPLALEQPDSEKMVGKPAPEIDAISLDTRRPAKLADFRGKVVLLEFWGYWCGPCLGNMPYLMELNRKYEGRPLAILALHDQSVQSRAVYDDKIATPREQKWGGRDLPFQVLLDRPDPKQTDELGAEGTGATIMRYGITGFPTLFVIDPDGTVVAQVPHWEHDHLEAIVAKLVEKAEGH